MEEAQALFDADSLLTCSICMEEFGEVEGSLPRLLQCGHTFCEACLALIAEGNDKVYCPKCRAETPIRGDGGVKDLVRNFDLLGIIFASSLAKEKKKENTLSKNTAANINNNNDRKCNNCAEEGIGEGGGNPATLYCSRCELFLCDRCDGQVHTLAAFKSHQRVEAAKAPPPKIYCKDHPDQPLQLWCQQDTLALCVLCCSVTHRNHDVITLEDRWKEVQQRVEEVKRVVEEGVDLLKGLEGHWEQLGVALEKDVQSEGERVEDFFNALMAATVARKREVLKELGRWKEERGGVIEMRREAVRKALEELMQRGEEVQRAGDKHSWLGVEIEQGPDICARMRERVRSFLKGFENMNGSGRDGLDMKFEIDEEQKNLIFNALDTMGNLIIQVYPFAPFSFVFLNVTCLALLAPWCP